MNNEPAFPLPLGSETTQGYEGMTLRDYLAAKAMQGILANPGTASDEKGADRAIQVISEISYKMASAMLKERNKPE